MKKIFKSVSKFVAGAVLGGAMLFGGTAAAADMNSEGMQLFAQALRETAKYDDRVFHNDLYVAMPGFVGNFDLDGVTENNSFRGKGDVNFWMLDDNGNVTEPVIPFYLTQVGKNFTIYFQNDKKKWNKATSPDLAAAFADMIATPTAQDDEALLKLIKEVTILQNTDSRCTMLVRFDGNSIADMYKEVSAANPMKPENAMEAAIQNQIEQYIDVGLRNSDTWYIWTVDKTKWQSVMVNANLSGFVQSIAQAALNDPSKDWGTFRNTLETLAYYSEVRLYTNYLNPAAKKQLEIPAKVLKAKEVPSITESVNTKK